MVQPQPESITFSESMMPSERRVATLGLLQDAGQLKYWGIKDGCYLVERGGNVEPLTEKQVDWLGFSALAKALGRAS